MTRDRLVEIKEDVFDISNRVKEVDSSYYLVYNLTKHRYEVHVAGRKDSLAIVVEGQPDFRTIVKLMHTHVRRKEELLREIEKSERQAESDKETACRNKIGESCEAFMRDNWKSR